MLDNIKKRAIQNLLFHCGQLKKQDRAIVLCDQHTKSIAETFITVAEEFETKLLLVVIPELKNHGEEPPVFAVKKMQTATLIISLCRYSLAHSNARIQAAKLGARFLSLPLYTWELLSDPSLQIDFKSHAQQVKKFSDAFTRGKKIHITTEAGTDITLDITNRIGNYCPGFVEKPGDLGSPPDIEANVSPIEDSAEGVVIIDGSITHPYFGLLNTPVKLTVQKGRITSFDSDCRAYVEGLNQLFGSLNSKRRVLAECGVGLNPAAKLTGTMLTDEGALGYLHFGFGANHTVGGLNEVDFHLDFVFRSGTLAVDQCFLIQAGLPII